MKTHHYLFIFIFSVTILVFPARGDDQDTRIGVITPLTGPNATIGAAIQNGIELARHEHAELLKGINFQYEDDQFDPKRDVVAYQKMMAGRGIDVLFGLGPVMVNVLWTYLERDKVPFINFNFVSAPAVGKPLVVRAMNHTDQYMQVLASYLKRDSSGEYAVVVGEHSFLKAMTRSLADALGSDPVIREVATVLPNETDFRSVILKLQKYKNKPVGLFLFSDSLLAFLKQARELRFSATYFGTDLCESAAKLAQDFSLLEGCIYPDNDASDTFRARYRGRYGNEAQLTFAGSAYDMTVLIGELFRREGKLKGQNFINALSKITNQKGVLGSYSFKNTPEAGSFFEYSIRVKVIKEGRGVAVE